MNYERVPNIISCKDLDYLSDMFNWNYGAYKCTSNSIDNVMDTEVKNILIKANDIFYQTLNDILNIINNGGSNE